MPQRSRFPEIGEDVTALMVPQIGDDVTSLMEAAMQPPTPPAIAPPPRGPMTPFAPIASHAPTIEPFAPIPSHQPAPVQARPPPPVTPIPSHRVPIAPFIEPMASHEPLRVDPILAEMNRPRLLPSHQPPVAEPPPVPATFLERLFDFGVVTPLKAAISVPEAAVGIMNLQTGGGLGEALGTARVPPAPALEILDTWYSDQQQR